MLHLPLYSPGPCFLTSKPRLTKISPLRRCNLPSAFCPGYLLLSEDGKWKISCHMKHRELDPSVNITDLNKVSDRFSKTEIQSIFQVHVPRFPRALKLSKHNLFVFQVLPYKSLSQYLLIRGFLATQISLQA
ncbi:unnamed protein product [Coffea canephora]|uniref:DH200=94 genomic scaffold, scaffold_1573 n=1 Tax=Coffea canephora TaxID=49390 RepID=A0A068VM12_COFCA|nr:unnamed protein product [Coffea canephora]